VSDTDKPTLPATPVAIKADQARRSESGAHILISDINVLLQQHEIERLRAKVAELEAELEAERASRLAPAGVRVLGVDIGGGPQQTFTGAGFDPRREP
jgi:hypothetical protein